jgi:hypothetical protein
MMADASIVGPQGGEAIQLGPIRMRILEDGATTAHRLGIDDDNVIEVMARYATEPADQTTQTPQEDR